MPDGAESLPVPEGNESLPVPEGDASLPAGLPAEAGSGVPFVKGHGTGNDFVLLPDPHGELSLTPQFVAAVCDRRTGVGADGVLHVVLSETVPGAAAATRQARWFMDYLNADGSPAEMCGNGIRVFARYLVQAGLADSGQLSVATRAGVKEVLVGDDGDITVDMGTGGPIELPAVAVRVDGMQLPGRPVSIGNPHVVVLTPVEVLERLDLRTAPTVQPAGSFPAGVNVEFVAALDGNRLRMRVHERGSGETQSCGTGACAAALAVGLPDAGEIAVEVPGGRLRVHRGPQGRLLLSGPAVLVAVGRLWVG